MKKTQTVPVSLRAVVQRIKRKLARDFKRLVARRPGDGYYYVVKDQEIVMLSTIADLAHRLGVLKPWESIQ